MKSVILRFTLPMLLLLHLFIQDGNDEIVFRHEVVLRHKGGKTTTETSFVFVLVEESPMMIIGVAENAINASTHGAEFGDRRLFDRDARREVFVAVEEASGAVERVSRVIHRRTLFRSLMRGAKEDPLFRRRHLRAGLRIALGLQFNSQSVQFEAKLAQVLVFPNSFILRIQRTQAMLGKTINPLVHAFFFP